MSAANQDFIKEVLRKRQIRGTNVDQMLLSVTRLFHERQQCAIELLNAKSDIETKNLELLFEHIEQKIKLVLGL